MIILRQKSYSDLKPGSKKIALFRDPKTGEKYEATMIWDGEKWKKGERQDRSNSASFRDADDFSSSVMAKFDNKKAQKSFTSIRGSKKLVRMIGKSAGKDLATGLTEPSKKTRDLLRKVKNLDKLRGPKTESGKKAFEKFDSNLENILDKASEKYLRRSSL